MKNVKKIEATTEKAAVIYVRVSTEDQKEGLSPDVQKALCRKLAESEGYRVLEVLDDSGISGFKNDRPGIIRIKQLIAEKKISAVVALSSDRLFRNTQAHIAMMNLVFEQGIRMLYVQQASPDSTATSVMSDTILATVNQFYRDQVSDKVKTTLYAKAQAGFYPTRPPAGYVNAKNPNSDGNRLAERIIVPDPEMAPLIRELFNLYSTGVYNVYDLADVMGDKGLRSHTGYRLSPSRVYDLLRNRVYLGEVHWGPIHNKDGKHEPLVDIATFNRVKAVLEMNNHKACRRRKHSWLLAGFVYCANHMKRYVAEWH